MTVPAIVASLLASMIPGWRALARRAWCSRQRTLLRDGRAKIVWLHDGDKMPWAFWGAEKGFFELEWAGRLPYLRASPAAG